VPQCRKSLVSRGSKKNGVEFEEGELQHLEGCKDGWRKQYRLGGCWKFGDHEGQIHKHALELYLSCLNSKISWEKG